MLENTNSPLALEIKSRIHYLEKEVRKLAAVVEQKKQLAIKNPTKEILKDLEKTLAKLEQLRIEVLKFLDNSKQREYDNIMLASQKSLDRLKNFVFEIREQTEGHVIEVVPLNDFSFIDPVKLDTSDNRNRIIALSQPNNGEIDYLTAKVFEIDLSSPEFIRTLNEWKRDKLDDMRAGKIPNYLIVSKIPDTRLGEVLEFLREKYGPTMMFPGLDYLESIGEHLLDPASHPFLRKFYENPTEKYIFPGTLVQSNLGMEKANFANVPTIINRNELKGINVGLTFRGQDLRNPANTSMRIILLVKTPEIIKPPTPNFN